MTPNRRIRKAARKGQRHRLTFQLEHYRHAGVGRTTTRRAGKGRTMNTLFPPDHTSGVFQKISGWKPPIARKLGPDKVHDLATQLSDGIVWFTEQATHALPLNGRIRLGDYTCLVGSIGYTQQTCDCSDADPANWQTVQARPVGVRDVRHEPLCTNDEENEADKPQII